MRIVYNKEEFAQLVRSCSISMMPDNGCRGCVFSIMCGQGAGPCEDDVMKQIEDICEIEPAVMAHGH